MMTLLQKQYELVRSSRGEVLNFIETEVGGDLNTPLPAFNGQTIRYFLVHNADCYLHWLAYFGMKLPEKSINNTDFTTVEKLRHLYSQVDDVVDIFLDNFKPDMDAPVSGMHDRCGEVTATPLELFTHVTTHEFHHKGQIMTMCRLLGHVPPDTDAIRF